MNKYIKISPTDNVCVAIQDLASGEKINIGDRQINILNDIPTGHKFAIEEIAEGQDVIKYGYPIGHATTAIHTGEHVHTQNV
ncbi:UxaA family hydrolase, partial [Dysgonomonas sp. BGC7]